MQLHILSIHATDGSRFDVSACFPRVKTVCFSKKRLVSSCRVHHDLQCPLLPTIDGITIDVLSNTADASSDIINQNIAQKWSSYYDLFTESRITHI